MDTLTAGEQRTFMLGLLCSTDGLNNIKVDYDKLAEKAGFKNAASASVLFNKSRRKILSALTEDGTLAPANGSPKKASDKVTKPRKSSAKGKGATITTDEESNGNEETQANPVKAPKARGGKGKAGGRVKADPMAISFLTRHRMVPIKGEVFVKEEPLHEDFAKGIIDGTLYSYSDVSLNTLWAVGAFSSGNGTTATGSPLNSEVDDETL
ncbi:histone h1.3., putative [Trichophyton verrucosum HKI 0517]|uniref:Histone h1.3., putative n=1 Tax=Trichophyton verrucosum (strain HKI 0517) TaxID=663202 RepID=D4DDL0_TRIVH|nr:histone h1.3., putative [Trichophyton verrucosum HKI 0517]EFE40077.1 histone h1.3., putative [Trichophyton verrucosum HKI 0517]